MRNDVCPGCGLDHTSISPPDAKVAIRSFGRRYRGALAAVAEDDAVEAPARRRPDADTWSALEYTGHVADVFTFLADAIERMHGTTAPSFDAPDFERRVEEARYNDRDPAVLVSTLDAAAERLAGAIDRVGHEGWHRTGTFPFGERDILTLTRNAVHEGSHHLRDVQRVLDATRRSR